jgi:hypothetical protein
VRVDVNGGSKWELIEGGVFIFINEREGKRRGGGGVAYITQYCVRNCKLQSLLLSFFLSFFRDQCLREFILLFQTHAPTLLS